MSIIVGWFCWFSLVLIPVFLSTYSFVEQRMMTMTRRVVDVVKPVYIDSENQVGNT